MSKTTDKSQSQTPSSETVTKQSLAYLGSVKVSIVKGKTTLATREFHNSGRPGLFKFICNALAGHYSADEAPAKIQLLNYKSTAPAEEWSWSNIVSADSDSWNKEEVDVVTVPLLFSTSPKIESTDGENYNTLFQFRIPYSIIADPYKFNILVLFPNKSILLPSNALAYYVLNSTKDNTETNEDGGIADINNSRNKDYSLLVEWRMSVQNGQPATEVE